MLSRSRYSGGGHAWNSIADMQLGSLLGGGVRILGMGVRKKGGSDEPPWLRAWSPRQARPAHSTPTPILH